MFYPHPKLKILSTTSLLFLQMNLATNVVGVRGLIDSRSG
jgi:hypothetical protein